MCLRVEEAQGEAQVAEPQYDGQALDPSAGRVLDFSAQVLIGLWNYE